MTAIDKMNELFRQELGSCPMGGKFQWRKAGDVVYYAQIRSFTTPQGVYIQGGTEKYQRMTYADRMGEDVWLLVKWDPPSLSETDWVNRFGLLIQYPAQGSFTATDVAMKPGVDPTMEQTKMLVGMIRQQLEEDYADHLARSTIDAEAREAHNVARIQNKLEDEIDIAAREPEGVIYSLPKRKDASNDVSLSRN